MKVLKTSQKLHSYFQRLKKLTGREGGQLSIFLGMSMTVLLSFLAFVVNVGLFVKAKINLQNAVDAAAFSGAAVQARQLTNMAYLNWEMRNVYKEWMFKYYVLGQMGLRRVNEARILENSQMNFRLEPFYQEGQSGFDPNVYDYFNVPSICIHFGPEHNICGDVAIPGLPRFNTVGLPGISEENDSFINTLVKTKAKDCSTRSSINFGTAMMWAYGNGKGNLFADTPLIASERPGAWIKAFELGIRMRNLESVMNMPAITSPLCLGGAGCTNAMSTFATGVPAQFERTSKAFFSAIKNLGGKLYDNNCKDSADHLQCSFKMTELPPNEKVVEPTSLSGYLIPGAASAALSKSYVDMVAYPVNLVTFFSSFISDTGDFKSTGVRSEADCAISKTALPVPSYLMGFWKNAEVMTYYAVKGEASFVGLMYPFANAEGIKLTAYAAAKPMGGRIGPRLFKNESQTITARQDTSHLTTSLVVSALNVASFGGTFNPRDPIPTDSSFWVQQASHQLGGTPSAGSDVFFGIPNLYYEFENAADLENQDNTGDPVQILGKATSYVIAKTADISQENKGLYLSKQYQQFKMNNLPPGAGVFMTAEQVQNALDNVRRPTKYEARNYLIPSNHPSAYTAGAFDAQPVVTTTIKSNGNFDYSFYAPLYGPGMLYSESSEVTEMTSAYLSYTAASIDKFLNALKKTSDSMRALSGSSTGGDAYLSAADSIYPPPSVSLMPPNGLPNSPACLNLSMAQKMNVFFKSGATICGITPLSQFILDYFDDNSNTPGFDQFFIGEFRPNDSATTNDFMTAYRPGPRQGAQEDGMMNLSAGVQLLGQRNYYSTKLISMDSVINNPKGTPYVKDISAFLESGQDNSFDNSDDAPAQPIHNSIDAGALSEFTTLDY